MKKNTKITIITLITLISIIFISVIIIKNTNKVNANSKSEEKTTINTTDSVEKPVTEKSVSDNTLDKKNTSDKKNDSNKKTDSNKNDKTKSNKNDSDKTDSNKNTSDNSNKTESTTEAKTETTTEAPKKDNGGKKEEGTTQKPKQESTTEKPKENNTEAPKKETTTEAKTEAKKEEACNHNWVWETHTVHHDAVTHTENHYSEAWDEAVYVTKARCAVCGTIYEDFNDYHARDNCGGGYGTYPVIDHYIHHESKLLWSEEIVDKEAYDEEVKDYQYCSKCGQKK